MLVREKFYCQKLPKTCWLKLGPTIVTLGIFMILFNVHNIVLELLFISLTLSNGSINDVQILTVNTINYSQEVIVNISIIKNRIENPVRLFFMGFNFSWFFKTALLLWSTPGKLLRINLTLLIRVHVLKRKICVFTTTTAKTIKDKTKKLILCLASAHAFFFPQICLIQN